MLRKHLCCKDVESRPVKRVQMNQRDSGMWSGVCYTILSPGSIRSKRPRPRPARFSGCLLLLTTPTSFHPRTSRAGYLDFPRPASKDGPCEDGNFAAGTSTSRQRHHNVFSFNSTWKPIPSPQQSKLRASERTLGV